MLKNKEVGANGAASMKMKMMKMAEDDEDDRSMDTSNKDRGN